jgi:hypothetical protein
MSELLQGACGPARLLPVPTVVDARGALGVLEVGRAVPFAVERLFYLYGVAPGAGRGGHAHRKQHQLLVALAGSFEVRIDNGSASTRVALGRRDECLHVPPLLWLDLADFSQDAVCAVLSSGGYVEADYLRDAAAFRAAVAEAGGAGR